MSFQRLVVALVIAWLLVPALSVPVRAQSGSWSGQDDGPLCESMPGEMAGRRVVCADVAALDSVLVYNRFGSYNPFGMMFALRRDLVPVDTTPTAITAEDCAADTGTIKDVTPLEPGAVRLRDCKRPRPMVLRANVGDLLVVQVENLLRPEAPGHSENFCRPGPLATDPLTGEVRAALSEGSDAAVARGVAACETGSATREPGIADPAEGEWPRTRTLNFAVQGLIAVADPRAPAGDPEAEAALLVCRGLTAIWAGDRVTCFYEIDQSGPFFLSSNAAPAGGEGDGGSITHGLFGSVVVQDRNTRWYRSQVSQAALDCAWKPVEPDLARRLATGDHRRQGAVNYAAATEDCAGGQGSPGVPVLDILQDRGPDLAREIVHSDLNAIVTTADAKKSFREFGVFFHDELKSFYSKNFEELGKYGQLAGVRDGFAINYGSSGMGAILLANRKGMGPAKDCAECLYEEFFLSSWANGDPALLERYADDPSNVHHSYLNDEIQFRNVHAGPKETHVFHLHAHQWFAGNDKNRGAYLDSQTVGPQQAFSYRIYGGGLTEQQGAGTDPWLAEVGSGNRNRGIGDSIFHCHLYPHFAQGMWELWRVHDVLEDGTRKLPDGDPDGRLSTETRLGERRVGSVDPDTGRWMPQQEGTPVPALVPLPGKPLPVLPTYAEPETRAGAEPFLTADAKAAMPGYPFYIGGRPGHRPPQAPMDLARGLRTEGPAGGPAGIAEGDYLDAGLPRHVVVSGERKAAADAGAGTPAQRIAKALAMGDMTAHLESAALMLLDYDGTPLERAAMGFHFDGKRWGDATEVAVLRSDGSPAPFDARGGYAVADPVPGTTAPVLFTVNGAPPKPGAPFADPCGGPASLPSGKTLADPLVTWQGVFTTDPAVAGFRRYEASAVQLDLVTNRAGWHDPQARINVLTGRSDIYKEENTPLGGQAISPFISAREEPFFFRAFSGECIEFRHTNEMPKELALDDFQLKTPTDTVGQHIHLVKFDVTASDGSGNGWNYEDGTLAPDEIATRICAAKTEDEAAVTATRDPRALNLREMPGLCVAKTEGGRTVWKPAPDYSAIWRLKRTQYPALFQTTVQRWFADPILSRTGEGASPADRTLRTVFSHDHFGPSSIQQHGFYTALIVEPVTNKVCDPKDTTNCRQIAAMNAVSEGDTITVGSHRQLLSLDPNDDNRLHPNTREYALAVADFGLLYDPRDTDPSADAAIAGDPKGLARLACEAANRNDPAALERCGSALATVEGALTDAEGDAIPSWNAAGRPGGGSPGTDIMTAADVAAMKGYLANYRARAALSEGGRLARPVAPPARPEAVSVDHHDPYLLNYRGEPMPLRLASKDGTDSPDCVLATMPRPGAPDTGSDAGLVTGARPCSYALQREGEAGEMSNVFLSALHGDPATPMIEAYAGEPVLIRLIQGAQEVQHVFNIEGFSFRRNLDQAFPRGEPPRPAPAQTQRHACDLLTASEGGFPLQYRDYFTKKALFPPMDAFFSAFAAAQARCINVEGNVAGQEIGISEHFEFSGLFQQTNPSSTLGVAAGSAPQAVGSDLSTPEGAADRRRFSTDYLYDFGTQDALWNGAWGLVRIYLDADAPDLTQCMAGSIGKSPAECLGTKVSDRITPLGVVPGSTLGTEGEARPPQTLAMACDPRAPQARAAVAAVEARRIWGDAGMSYGPNSHDPDGLVLLALDPEGLEARLARPSAVAAFEAELRALYADDPVEPYVLPVMAGECVELTVVNLMPDVLRDDYGDARMPLITPLNTTPAASLLREASADSPQVQALHLGAGPWRNGLRPSSRLAMRFPLPVMNTAQSIALPFGYNATGAVMSAGQGVRVADNAAVQPLANGYLQRTATVERLTFYAGKFSGDAPDTTVIRNRVAQNLRRRLQSVTDDPVLAAVATRPIALAQLQITNAPSDAATIAGRQYAITVQPALTDVAQRQRLARLAEEEGAKVLAGYANFMPYAFGALPIKPFGDVIGQPAHGLTGAVLVLPKDARIEGSPLGSPTAPRLVRPRQTPAGQAVAYSQDRICDDGAACGPTPAEARNFVLFYQDGLNLWDRGSRIRWTRDNGAPLADAARLKMQPDCAVCDDSYDFGDRAVSYHAAPLHHRLRDPAAAGAWPEANSNLNSFVFPSGLWMLRAGEDAAGAGGIGAPKSATPMAVLRARAGEEVTISILEPGGRARQRVFATIAQGYDDLFPGFGFPNAALMAPGKAVNAALSGPVRPGCYLWHDGPTHLRADGVWGLLDVVAAEDYADADVTSCRAP